MAGSVYGDLFKISTFGESHGGGLGVVVDGCPAGIPIDEAVIMEYMNRRRPGGIRYSTPRNEADSIRILSGVFEGKTTGTPVMLFAGNTDRRSKDYSDIATYYRPGHADYTYDAKYGFRDYRGGGRSSGRETLGRVAAGAVALTFLKELGIDVLAYTKSIGHVTADTSSVDREAVMKSSLYMPDLKATEEAERYLDELIAANDSAGGVVECVIKGLPAGIGEPVFGKLDARLAEAVMSIGAVKGFEIGAGFAAAGMRGSENNDSFISDDGIAQTIHKKTNNSGGILGGISDGSDVVFRAAFKPTPSIGCEQDTVTTDGENVKKTVIGRHDPVIVPRAVVVVEAMAGIVVADLILKNMASKLSDIKKIYR